MADERRLAIVSKEGCPSEPTKLASWPDTRVDRKQQLAAQDDPLVHRRDGRCKRGIDDCPSHCLRAP